jgi:phytoene desaturase
LGGQRRLVVIGAGVGGLCAAARLRRAGFAVTVLEKNGEVGGRLGRIERAGYRWDSGPTLLLMRDVYEEFFASFGRRLDEELPLRRLDPNYRIRFADGRTLDSTSRIDLLVHEVERFEPGAGPRLLRFLADAAQKYRLGRRAFVERGFERASAFFSPHNGYYLVRSGAAANYWRHVSRYFSSPALRQAFSLQTIYLGLSPFHAPAIYTLLPYTELVEDGLWFPEGGLYALAEALLRVAQAEGVELRTNCAVTRIPVRGGRVCGVETADGFVPADVVLANADLPYTYQHLLPDGAPRDFGCERIERFRYSCSAHMLYLGVRGTFPHLLHHNFVLGRDFRGTLDQIFARQRLPDDPACYVCAPSITDPSFAPPGCSSVLVLTPVPAESPRVDWARDGAAFRERVLTLLETRAGMTGLRDRIEVCIERTPDGWRSAYNLHRGAAFGLAHGLFQVGWFRPDTRSRALPNLYFVGASTRPGTGVPLVMIGARLVAERIVREQGQGTRPARGVEGRLR